MSLICLHGFLGSPQDFDFLSASFDTYCPDLDAYIDKEVGEILEEISLKTSKRRVLIGYSFGARMAMQVFLKSPSSFDSLYLLAGHAGIETQEQRIKRESIECHFKKQINELAPNDFYDYWNNLDLFNFDEKLETKEFDKNCVLSYFEKWGLSKQPFLRDELLKYKDKIKWYFGEKDFKYVEYARENLFQFDVHFIKNTGHRLLKDKSFQSIFVEELKW